MVAATSARKSSPPSLPSPPRKTLSASLTPGAYGLAPYLYSRDLNRLLRVAEQIEFGIVGFNTGVISNAPTPFGRVVQSGLGRDGGTEYSNTNTSASPPRGKHPF